MGAEEKKIIMVKCTFILPVEVPSNASYNEVFDIEENHCPGTGFVGGALDELMEKHRKGNTCWACAVGGECEILTPPSKEDNDYLVLFI